MVFQRFQKISGICLFASFLFIPAAYSSSPGTSIFSFLKIDPSARLAGMGEVDSDVNSQSALANPAVLPWLYDYSEVSLQHLLYFSDVSFSQAAYTRPLSTNSSLNLSLGYLGTGAFTRTIADSSVVDGYSERGSFTTSDMLIGAGYGRRLSAQFSYGVGMKAVRESIDGNDTYGAMMSLTGFYNPLSGGHHYRDDQWQVGFGVFNVGPKVGNYDLPMGGFVGVGKRLSPPFFFGLEMAGYIDQTMEGRLGMEYDLSDALFLRAGYKNSFKEQGLGDPYMTGLSGGLGFRIQQFVFDYAWVPYGDLGQTHRVTLSLQVGGSEANLMKRMRKQRK